MRRTLILAVSIVIAVPSLLMAVITFNQLDDDIFTVSHTVKGLGRRAKAMNMLYEKVSSLCVAAGFDYYTILDQESQAPGYYEQANASARVQFFLDDGEGRIGCERNAQPEYVDQARKKLAKQGYKPPARDVSEGSE